MDLPPAIGFDRFRSYIPDAIESVARTCLFYVDRDVYTGTHKNLARVLAPLDSSTRPARDFHSHTCFFLLTVIVICHF